MAVALHPLGGRSSFSAPAVLTLSSSSPSPPAVLKDSIVGGGQPMCCPFFCLPFLPPSLKSLSMVKEDLNPVLLGQHCCIYNATLALRKHQLCSRKVVFDNVSENSKNNLAILFSLGKSRIVSFPDIYIMVPFSCTSQSSVMYFIYCPWPFRARKAAWMDS